MRDLGRKLPIWSVLADPLFRRIRDRAGDCPWLGRLYLNLYRNPGSDLHLEAP